MSYRRLVVSTIMSSTPSTSRDSDLEQTGSLESEFDPPSLDYDYAVTHVFLPVNLPKTNGYGTIEMDHSLVRTVCAASHAYSAHIYGTSEQARWHRITKMLDSLQVSVQSEHLDKGHVISQLHGMRTGGTRTLAGSL
jgi:hypothetical protein